MLEICIKKQHSIILRRISVYPIFEFGLLNFVSLQISLPMHFFSVCNGSPSSPTITLMLVLPIFILKSILFDDKTIKLLSFDQNFSGASFSSPLLLPFLDSQIIDVFLGNSTFLNNLNSIRPFFNWCVESIYIYCNFRYV